MRTIRSSVHVPVALLVLALVPPAGAAELQAKTVAAFERYVRATEARIEAEVRDESQFLWRAVRPGREGQARLAALGRGEVVIEPLTTLEMGRAIDVPDGLVHHWVGLAFLPGVRLSQAVALLQDYDRHGDIYRPRVARSALRARQGDAFRFYLRFVMTKIITVVIDGEHEAQFSSPAPDRAYSRIRSTRLAEIAEAGTPREHEKPVGHDGGYLWRLNTYWRFLERDGGTYVQCESVSLTRDIPTGFGWLVGPFVTSLPRESLEFTMRATRTALVDRH